MVCKYFFPKCMNVSDVVVLLDETHFFCFIVTPNHSRRGSLANHVGGKKYLSQFQIDKLTYMFNAFFDVHDGDGVIEKTDISELLDKLRTYCGYLRLKSDSKYMQMNDVMFAFYNAMVDQVKKEKASSEDAEGFSTVN